MIGHQLTSALSWLTSDRLGFYLMEIESWHRNSTRSLSRRPAGGRSAPAHRPPPKESIQFDTGRGNPAFYRSIRGGLSRPTVGTTSLLSGASHPVSFLPTSCETVSSQRLLAASEHHLRSRRVPAPNLFPR